MRHRSQIGIPGERPFQTSALPADDMPALSAFGGPESEVLPAVCCRLPLQIRRIIADLNWGWIEVRASNPLSSIRFCSVSGCWDSPKTEQCARPWIRLWSWVAGHLGSLSRAELEKNKTFVPS